MNLFVEKNSADISLSALQHEIHYKWLTPIDISKDFIEGVIVLLNQVAIRERNMGFSQPIDLSETENFQNMFVGELESGAHLLSAFDGNALIGIVTIMPCGLPARKHVAEVKRCVISIEYRGRNILSKGWVDLLEKCAAHNIQNLTIDVRTDYPRTLKLWKLLGFVEYGRMSDYARMDGEKIDGVFLQYRLPSTIE
jgi:L-amino acid N-acyltransferase YncA